MQPLSRNLQGHIEFKLSTHLNPARLEVRGAEQHVKQIGAGGNALALPLAELQPGDYVVSANVKGSISSFPKDEQASVSVIPGGTGDSYLVKDIPIGGRTSAELLVLRVSEVGAVSIVAPAQPQESTGLGGWAANRLAEMGRDTTITVSDVYLDTSASMDQYSGLIVALKEFFDSYSRATKSVPPTWQSLSIGDTPNQGVGTISNLPTGDQRSVIITDLPPHFSELESLIVGDPEVASYLWRDQTTTSYIAGVSAQELEASTGTIDKELVERVVNLADWLCQPQRTESADNND